MGAIEGQISASSPLKHDLLDPPPLGTQHDWSSFYPRSAVGYVAAAADSGHSSSRLGRAPVADYDISGLRQR